MRVQVRRVYDPPGEEDGTRVLVDRLWPRGLRREQVDEWLKDVAPSPNLRQWFGHDPARFAEFAARYGTELRHNPAVGRLYELAEQFGTLTLLYAARDTEHNHAVVLRDHLTSRHHP